MDAIIAVGYRVNSKKATEFRIWGTKILKEDMTKGFALNDEIICEATAYIKESAFIGDISDPSGLLSDNMAYLATFRTNKEFEGQGYFRKLYDFIENDLKEKGYNELSLGVEPEVIRNIEIYFHLGYRDYIKTVIEYEASENNSSKKEEDVILFYKKKIRK